MFADNNLHRKLNLVMAAVAVLLVLQLGVQLFSSPASEQQVSLVFAETSSVALSMNWFAAGQGLTPAQSSLEDQRELEDARIDAELLGIVITRDNAAATIKFRSEPEQVFRIGEEIGNGVEITAITPSRVIVRQGGRDMQIVMKTDEALIIPSAASQRNQSRRSGNALEDIAIDEVVNLSGDADNSGRSGYLVSDLAPDMASIMDIEDGDLIISVGNIDVETLMSEPDRISEFMGQTNLPVILIRDGQEQTVYVDVDSLTSRFIPFGN